MAASYKKYIKEIGKKFGYHATWTPDTKIELGDIGIFKNKVFQRVGSISSFDFEIEVRKTTTPTKLLYQSQKSVTLTFKASGSIVPKDSALGKADAGMIVQFGKNGGVLFKAEGVYSHSIKNEIELHRLILEQYHLGTWQKNWVIVTEIKVADLATILYSSTSNAKIELKGNAALNFKENGENENEDVGTDTGESWEAKTADDGDETKETDDVDGTKEVEEKTTENQEEEKESEANTETLATDIQSTPIHATSGLSIVSSKNMDIEIVASGGATPLFKSVGIRKKFLGRASIQPKTFDFSILTKSIDSENEQEKATETKPTLDDIGEIPPDK